MMDTKSMSRNFYLPEKSFGGSNSLKTFSRYGGNVEEPAEDNLLEMRVL